MKKYHKRVRVFICFILVIAFMVVVLGCTSINNRINFITITPEQQKAHEDDIYEAAFLYLLKKEEHHLKKYANAYYLYFLEDNGHAFTSNDPSESFMKRVEGMKPPMKKYSECTYSTKDGAIDIVTGKQGVLFGAYDLTWIRDGRVTLDVSFNVDGTYGAGFLLTVVKRRNQWIVKGCKMTFVS